MAIINHFPSGGGLQLPSSISYSFGSFPDNMPAGLQKNNDSYRINGANGTYRLYFIKKLTNTITAYSTSSGYTISLQEDIVYEPGYIYTFKVSSYDSVYGRGRLSITRERPEGASETVLSNTNYVSMNLASFYFREI